MVCPQLSASSVISIGYPASIREVDSRRQIQAIILNPANPAVQVFSQVAVFVIFAFRFIISPVNEREAVLVNWVKAESSTLMTWLPL